MATLRYVVQTFRSAGLEARWARTRSGAPIIVARNPNARSEHQRARWWAIDRSCWKLMEELGVVEGFDSATFLGDLFSVPI